MAEVGVTHEQIGAVLGISPDTITKYYSDELATAAIKALVKVHDSLMKLIEMGDTSATIFYMKAKGGWKDRPTEKEATVNSGITYVFERGPTRKSKLKADDEKAD